MDQAHKLSISRGLQAATIDTTVLRELVIEAYQHARHAYRNAAPDTVQVGSQQAHLKLTEPSRRVRYHRPSCRHFGVPDHDRVAIPLRVAGWRGYEPCAYCTDLFMTHWSQSIGLDPTQVNAIVNKSVNHIRNATAVKIFRAIGEQPHPSLLVGVHR